MFVKTTRETKKTVIGHLQPKWTYAKVTRKETPEKTIDEQQGHTLSNQIASCVFELTSKLMTLHHINRAFARTRGFYARFYLCAFSRVVNKHDAKKQIFFPSASKRFYGRNNGICRSANSWVEKHRKRQKQLNPTRSIVSVWRTIIIQITLNF